MSFDIEMRERHQDAGEGQAVFCWFQAVFKYKKKKEMDKKEYRQAHSETGTRTNEYPVYCGFRDMLSP